MNNYISNKKEPPAITFREEPTIQQTDLDNANQRNLYKIKMNFN